MRHITQRSLALARLALVLFVAGLGAVLAAGAEPPSIDDLDGAVCALKVSGKGYSRATGASEAIKGQVLWILVKTGPDTLVIHQQDDTGVTLWQGHYKHGVLLAGAVNDGALATEAACAHVLVSGTKGKLKLKGDFVSFTAGSDEAALGTFSGKETVLRK